MKRSWGGSKEECALSQTQNGCLQRIGRNIYGKKPKKTPVNLPTRTARGQGFLKNKPARPVALGTKGHTKKTKLYGGGRDGTWQTRDRRKKTTARAELKSTWQNHPS